jgi:hypothetical protein
VVATNLLGRVCGTGGSKAANQLLADAVAGEVVGGVARLVPAGAVANAVLCVDADEVVALRSAVSPRSPLEVPSNLGTAPLADRGAGVDQRVVLASGPQCSGCGCAG